MRKLFDDGTIRMDYETVGEGQPVVLLHGFAEDGSVWRYQTEFLKDHCQVVVPEWWQVIDGVGQRADDLPVAGTCTIDHLAGIIAAFIKHISDRPVILLGHSMGGYIALAMAEKYPSLLKGFGLVHSTAFADSEEKKSTRKKSIDFIRTFGSVAFLRTSVPTLFGGAYKQGHAAEMEGLIVGGNKFSKAAMVACCEAMMLRPDRKWVLQGSKLPILFILGEEDKAAPMEDVLKQVYLPKISYFHLLQKVGHMGIWEAPLAVNGFILTYLQGFFHDR